MPKSNNQAIRMMRMKDVQKYTSISRSHLFSLIKDGDFPAGKSISIGVVCWEKSAVDEWIDQRMGLST